MINSYVALDLETSGLNPLSDKIIEIGMVKVLEGKVTAQYETLINPQVMLDARIQQLTGIRNDMVSQKPIISEVIGEITEFIGELPLLGHNIIFDYSFLKKAAINHQLHFEKQGIDTLKIARRILPEVEHKNLDYLCKYFGIDPGNSHRAFDDAMSAKMLYERLYEVKPEDEGFKNLIQLQFNVKKDSPITAAQKKYLTRLISFYHVTAEEEVDLMTKSSASRLIDKILSEYGKMPY